MERLAPHIAPFLRSESGAVTVDWVVLTSGLAGLGLAVIAVVSGGVRAASDSAATQIASTPIQTRFPTVTQLFSSDFTGGAGGWIGGTATALAGFGDVLQLGQGETATLTLSVPPGSTSATLSFDMIGGDDLDGEPATISINGTAVALYADDHGTITLGDTAPPGVTVSVSQAYSNTPLGAGSHGSDSLATYTITVDDPGTTLTLGVHSGADEDTGNEFYALDNVAVSAQ